MKNNFSRGVFGQVVSLALLLGVLTPCANAATMVLTPTIDLTSDGTTITDTATLAIGNPSGDPVPADFRSVAKFDLSSIPGPITGASLTLNQTSDPADPSGVFQFGFLFTRAIGTPWDGASTAAHVHSVGADTNAIDLFGTGYVAPGTDVVIGGLESLAEAWRDGSFANNGIAILQGAEGFTLTGQEYAASEAGATGPRLTVTYEAIPEPATALLGLLGVAGAVVTSRRRLA